MPQRKIIHCDCDCFYAAVEMRDRPELARVCLAVGGAGGRGVVATCNYAARQYGVRSAMPMSEARRRCPDLVIVEPDMARYRAVSREVMTIFREYTPLVEPLSLDEAYLDVTESDHCKGSATLIAQELRERVRQEIGITVSAGVAPNKFLAKVASDWQKPDGLFVITPEQVEGFVRGLAVDRLFGVGAVTARKLREMGLETCGHLQAMAREALVERFGKQGARLYDMARGIDDRPVRVDRTIKSVSVERTFSQDLPNLEACERELESLADDLARRLERRRSSRPIHKLFVKLRFSDFSTHSLERAQSGIVTPTAEQFLPLLRELYGERGRAVRLLGMGVRFVETHSPAQQLPLFTDALGSAD